MRFCTRSTPFSILSHSSAPPGRAIVEDSFHLLVGVEVRSTSTNLFVEFPKKIKVTRGYARAVRRLSEGFPTKWLGRAGLLLRGRCAVRRRHVEGAPPSSEYPLFCFASRVQNPATSCSTCLWALLSNDSSIHTATPSYGPKRRSLRFFRQIVCGGAVVSVNLSDATYETFLLSRMWFSACTQV